MELFGSRCKVNIMVVSLLICDTCSSRDKDAFVEQILQPGDYAERLVISDICFHT